MRNWLWYTCWTDKPDKKELTWDKGVCCIGKSGQHLRHPSHWRLFQLLIQPELIDSRNILSSRILLWRFWSSLLSSQTHRHPRRKSRMPLLQTEIRCEEYYNCSTYSNELKNHRRSQSSISPDDLMRQEWRDITDRQRLYRCSLLCWLDWMDCRRIQLIPIHNPQKDTQV